MKITNQSTTGRMRWIILVLSTIVASGCVNENWSDCFPPTITVTLEAAAGHDPIQPSEVDHIWLYIFEARGGTLLDRIHLSPDRIGVPQVVDYPKAGALRVVAVANCLDRTEMSEPGHGGHIVSGAVGPMRNAQDFQGMPRYETCDDLMWGEAVVRNNADGASENVILPVKRIVAGIYIRVSGLKNIPGIVPAQVQVALGAKYNTFTFAGAVQYDASRATHPNFYHVPATGCNPHNANVVEAPAYVDGQAQFFRILSTDDGDDVTISLFNGATPFGTNLTHDTSGNPLKARNGKLNVFELEFNSSGQVGVTVSQAKWGDTPDLEIDF